MRLGNERACPAMVLARVIQVTVVEAAAQQVVAQKFPDHLLEGQIFM